jgi:predicted ester cyclase
MDHVRRKALVRRFYDELWGHGSPGVAFELFSPDYVRHDLRPGHALPGPEGQVAIARLFRSAFPDLAVTVDLVVADDTFVVGRWTMTATHLGAWGGIPPTGRRVCFCGANIFRFEGDKAVELWNHRDDLGLSQQIGDAVYAGHPVDPRA